MRSSPWLGLVLAGVAGCAGAEPPKVTPAAKPAATAQSTEAPGEPDVRLAVVSWPQLEQAIAAHKGKVVVLDVWAEY